MSLSSVAAAKGHIDQRMAAEAEKIARGEEVEGRYLTYFLSRTSLPMKTVYSNVTELLLAGVDTVGPTSPPTSCWSSRLAHLSPAPLLLDLQHFVLVAVRAVPSPGGAGLAAGGGAERARGSKGTDGSRRGPDASAEGHNQRSTQVGIKRFPSPLGETFALPFSKRAISCFSGCTPLFPPTPE